MFDYITIRSLTNWQIDKSLSDEKFGVKFPKSNGLYSRCTPLSKAIRDTIREVGRDLKDFNDNFGKVEAREEILGKIKRMFEDVKLQKESFDKLENPKDVKKALKFAQKLEKKLTKIQALCTARFEVAEEKDTTIIKDVSYQTAKAIRQLTFSKNVKYAKLVEAKKTISSRVDNALAALASNIALFKSVLNVFGWKAADAVKLLDKNYDDLKQHLDKLRALSPQDPYFNESLEKIEGVWKNLKITAKGYANLSFEAAERIVNDQEIDVCISTFKALLDPNSQESSDRNSFVKLYSEIEDLKSLENPDPLKLANKAAIGLGMLEILWDKDIEFGCRDDCSDLAHKYLEQAGQLAGLISEDLCKGNPLKADTWKFALEAAEEIARRSKNLDQILQNNKDKAEKSEAEKAEKLNRYEETKKHLLDEGGVYEKWINGGAYPNLDTLNLWLTRFANCKNFAEENKINFEEEGALIAMHMTIDRYIYRVRPHS